MTDEQLSDLELWKTALGRRMQTFEEKLEANTEATARVESNTKAIVDLFESWTGAMKVIELVGKLAKPLAAIAALITAVVAWRHK
jgi:hypothetical protein